jgi:hypothetical protein
MSIGFDQLKELDPIDAGAGVFCPLRRPARKAQRSTSVREDVEQVLALAGDPFSGAFNL